ncbi:MAG TPA: ATP synthase F1 subunit delta [Bryobacteraceae bacterium]|jgi:F-type H+-transporting ATPase subunit delta|nr:ATP synthase F1 subunit delta [Bryobacteraceae bacterium]
MPSAVANRYARALADVVMTPGSSLKPEDAVAQLNALDAIIQGSLELRTGLQTPAIQNSRKRAVMAKILEEIGGGSPLIRNFAYVLIDHRRIAISGDIREAFELEIDQRLGFARAEVTSAVTLDHRVSANLETELSRLTGKRMRLRFDVDPALLGGVVARIGSTVYDGSVRGELLQLGRKLAGLAG